MCVCWCVCVGGGALLKFKLFRGDFICFLWTETKFAFLDQTRTWMGTPTQRLQVKNMVITLFVRSFRRRVFACHYDVNHPHKNIILS